MTRTIQEIKAEMAKHEALLNLHLRNHRGEEAYDEEQSFIDQLEDELRSREEA